MTGMIGASVSAIMSRKIDKMLGTVPNATKSIQKPHIVDYAGIIMPRTCYFGL